MHEDGGQPAQIETDRLDALSRAEFGLESIPALNRGALATFVLHRPERSPFRAPPLFYARFVGEAARG